MDPKQALLAKLTQIFSDGVVDDAEKSSLRALLASGLSSQDILETFSEFVAVTWKGTIDDGRVTEVEKKRLREIVRVLGLDATALPREWRVLLGER
jgi:hypothetical protein